MITDGKQSDEIDKWHYIDLKSDSIDNGFNRPIRSLPRLFRGITSNNNRYFYCFGCLHSFRTDNKLKRQKRSCDNHDYCHIEMPTGGNNTLKYNHGEKSLKLPSIIYVDSEPLLIKQQLCQNCPEESYMNLFMNLVVILYIQLIHLIQNKTDIVLIEEETALKNFVKI